jgi:hypothetical protein
LSIGSPI